MARRFIPVLLIALLVIVHAQIWFGRGSVPRVASLKQQLATQELANRDAQLRNDQLVSEVSDLQEGLGMVEELARQELGMVKPNEIFVQIAKGKN
ncbi:septum formation initiator family protein [Hydrogenophaga sp. 2FB]|uniref:septum formation initiator family protein n=1 Tax=Hydrogenophaga sp. 2FB TaxID=2502187 RepID=UPI0010F65194|nr:septum formation initiator family protein [Hydrogenophaga sp. 2FB]